METEKTALIPTEEPIETNTNTLVEELIKLEEKEKTIVADTPDNRTQSN
jgi:hypothetical protein